jgi:hypothetical protein
MVDLSALPAEQQAPATVAGAHPHGRQVPEPHTEPCLIARQAPIARGRALDPDHLAATAFTHPEADRHTPHQSPLLAQLYSFFRSTSCSLG